MGAHSGTDWRAPLKDLGHDLFNRQINLIVTTGGMIGNSAPPSRPALQQIATAYAECLRIKDPFAVPVSADLGSGEELDVYQAAFKKLKEKGDSLQEPPRLTGGRLARGGTRGRGPAGPVAHR